MVRVSESFDVSHQRISVNDVTAILGVSITVDGFQFDSSIMEYPEFLIATVIIFQCQQFGGKHLQTQWTTYRTFHEFQGLDTQLRHTFPDMMQNIKSPRVHRRRAFFRLNRSKGFLLRRCRELNDYLVKLLQNPTMRLSRFMDPRAPLVLRCFCNFDAGFGRSVMVRRNQFDSCVLCLDHLRNLSATSDETDVSIDKKKMMPMHYLPDHPLHYQWLRQQLMQADTDGRYNELEKNLLDDRARNMVMCQKFECACQYSSFRVTHNKMSRILQQRGYRQVYRPLEGGITALYCVLYKLQQHNDLDKRLYDALRGLSLTKTKDNDSGNSEDAEDPSINDQLAIGVESLRHALSNYGLLYVHELAVHFRMAVVDVKKKLHQFKSKQQSRVGALELVLLSTMLDLSIKLITNDHEGSQQLIFPLEGFSPIRKGGRIFVTLAYILPTVFCVNGYYLLAESLLGEEEAEERLSAEVERTRMWLGVEEMERCLIALIDEVLQTDLPGLHHFDYDEAESLNKAILDAVWEDCEHNPNLFHLFQRQARQFGKSRSTATAFLQYLEVAFGVEGAAYLVDFLQHVLPEEELRKQLLRARWMRVRRQLVKKVSA